MQKVVLNRMDSESTLVREVMTTPVVTLHPNTDAEEALALMLDRNIRQILWRANHFEKRRRYLLGDLVPGALGEECGHQDSEGAFGV